VKSKYALFSPTHGWFAGMDGTPDGFRFTRVLGHACMHDCEDVAVCQGIALMTALGGDAFWVYEVVLRPRRGWRTV
jgi:hypothetical protein